MEFYGYEDVYNMEVDKYHNYALSAGIIVKNSQSNRASFDNEIVMLSGIAESYAKAMIADFVVTMSRRLQDKLANTGRFFIAKNRYGQDGLILPILINTETSKIEVLKSNSLQDSILEVSNNSNSDNLSERLAERYRNFQKLNSETEQEKV